MVNWSFFQTSVGEVQDLCLVRLQQNLRRICPAGWSSVALVIHGGERAGNVFVGAAPSCGCAVEIRAARLCSTEPTMSVSVVTHIPELGAKSLLGNLIPFEKNRLAGSSGHSRLGLI